MNGKKHFCDILMDYILCPALVAMAVGLCAAVLAVAGAGVVKLFTFWF